MPDFTIVNHQLIFALMMGEEGVDLDMKEYFKAVKLLIPGPNNSQHILVK